jgi:hypothetical protein
MFTIVRAVTDDFERVYPQIQQCFEDSLAREEWKKIFANYWESPEDFCGYMLLKDGEVKGYLGLLFSNRNINNKIEKFCNLTSWCVNQECRSRSLPLLLEALKLKDYTFTNFTASPTVAAVLRRLGFTEFEVNQQVIFPIASFRFGPRECVCEFDPNKIRNSLSPGDRVIFDDHQHFNCEHLLLRSGSRYSYVILKRTWRKHLPFAKVHFLSDAGPFVAGIGKSMPKICLRLKVLGLMVDERYLGNHRLKRSVSYPHQRRAYFKPGSSALDSTQIDTLYSELVVLHS